MKVAVVGSRSFNSKKHAAIIFGVLDALKAVNYITTVVSGACPNGPDHWATVWAKDRKVELIEYPALWTQHGRGAGYARNSDIAAACDVLVAFWDGSSRGTVDTMNKAKALGKLVFYDRMDGKGFQPF